MASQLTLEQAVMSAMSARVNNRIRWSSGDRPKASSTPPSPAIATV